MPSEFESSSENEALKEAIIERIREEGGITFHDFMRMALYHPGLGYYCSSRDKMGRSGDYLTSPEVSTIFGAMVGRQLREMWEAMGSAPAFQVVEAGGASGVLCRDILRWARRTELELFQAVEYVIVEVSEALVEGQAASVSEGLQGKIRWAGELRPGIEGCVLSNELLDAQPVHRVAVESGRLREVFVIWNGVRFAEELRAPSSPEIEEYFQRAGLSPGEGCRAEVNLEALRWMREAANALSRGFVMTFDYGYDAAELYAPWRQDGTLLCFYRHNPSNDPYARIGRQDITAHLDLTAVRKAGEEAGLTTLGIVSQTEFLTNMGIAEAVSPPGEGESDPSAPLRAGLEEYYARRRALIELLDPSGLGRIRVLIQSKGMGDVRLSGLGEGRW